MTKFEFIHNNNKEERKISTAINNIKNKLLENQRNIPRTLEKQAKKHHLNPNELLEKTIEVIKKENNGYLPENLKKYKK